MGEHRMMNKERSAVVSTRIQHFLDATGMTASAFASQANAWEWEQQQFPHRRRDNLECYGYAQEGHAVQAVKHLIAGTRGAEVWALDMFEAYLDYRGSTNGSGPSTKGTEMTTTKDRFAALEALVEIVGYSPQEAYDLLQGRR